MYKAIGATIRHLILQSLRQVAPQYIVALREISLGRMPIRIREIVTARPTPSPNRTPRLNLVLPTIDTRYTYGGISTALAFFRELATQFSDTRIIITNSLVPSERHRGEQPECRIETGGADHAGHSIVGLHRNTGALSIRANDYFITTAWWTAHAVLQILPWQAEHYSQDKRPFVYLVQDYEPGFYPWSSQYALAESTYRLGDLTIAVFNTDMLRQFFRDRGYTFFKEYSFEPSMNAALRTTLMDSKFERAPKQKIILVYGRPTVPRNAFSLLVAALKIWAQRMPNPGEWRVISVGEAHPNIDLHQGVVMKSAGKLSIGDYAKHLQEAGIGVSLMISPHPSYPPLEMAHFGLLVVCNRFENKDLSSWHDNIYSIDSCDPVLIADRLVESCQKLDADRMIGYAGQSHLPDYLSGTTQQFPFLDELNDNLCRNS